MRAYIDEDVEKVSTIQADIDEEVVAI